MVQPFALDTMPILTSLLNTHQSLSIFFQAAAYKISPKDPIRNRMQVGMVDEYNKQLSGVILEAVEANEALRGRLRWMQVTEKIVLTPIDNMPLALDGTHLSQQNEPLAVGLQASHRSILEVMFNVYCRNFVKFSADTCCK